MTEDMIVEVVEPFVAFLIYLWFSIVVSVFADGRRNRRGGLWFILAFVFSPVLIFPLVASLPTLQRQPSMRELAEAAVKAPATS
jgi:hypothetical protein